MRFGVNIQYKHIIVLSTEINLKDNMTNQTHFIKRDMIIGAMHFRKVLG